MDKFAGSRNARPFDPQEGLNALRRAVRKALAETKRLEKKAEREKAARTKAA